MNIDLILYNNISILIYLIILGQKHIGFKVIHCTSRRYIQWESRRNFDTSLSSILIDILNININCKSNLSDTIWNVVCFNCRNLTGAILRAYN
jgi:hypothetical protein